MKRELALSTFLAVLAVCSGSGWSAEPHEPKLELQSEEDVSGSPMLLWEKGTREGRGPLRMKIQGNSLVISSPQGAISREVPLEEDSKAHVKTRVTVSAGRRVVALHTTRGIRPESESWRESEYRVYDLAGKETLVLKNPGGSRIVPSPSGTFAVGLLSRMAPAGPPLFLDASGVRNKWLKGFGGGTWPEKHYAEQVSFSEDGSKVAVDARLTWRKSLVLIYSSNGDELGRIDDVKSPVFSPSGAFVALQCMAGKAQSVFCLADGDGKILWRDSETYKGDHRVVFSSDESRVVFVSGFGLARSFNTRTGKPLWAWAPGLRPLDNGFEPFATRGLDSSADGSVVAISGIVLRPVGPGNVERSKDIAVVVADGLKVSEVAFPAGALGTVATASGGDEMNVTIDEPGGTISLVASGKLRTYRIKKAAR